MRKAIPENTITFVCDRVGCMLTRTTSISQYRKSIAHYCSPTHAHEETKIMTARKREIRVMRRLEVSKRIKEYFYDNSKKI